MITELGREIFHFLNHVQDWLGVHRFGIAHFWEFETAIFPSTKTSPLPRYDKGTQ